jgi:hypothetical protein
MKKSAEKSCCTPAEPVAQSNLLRWGLATSALMCMYSTYLNKTLPELKICGMQWSLTDGPMPSKTLANLCRCAMQHFHYACTHPFLIPSAQLLCTS